MALTQEQQERLEFLRTKQKQAQGNLPPVQLNRDERSFFEKFGAFSNKAGEFMAGGVQSLLGTAKAAGQFVGEQTVGRLPGVDLSQSGAALDRLSTPTSKAMQAGKTAGNIAQFLAPNPAGKGRAAAQTGGFLSRALSRAGGLRGVAGEVAQDIGLSAAQSSPGTTGRDVATGAGIGLAASLVPGVAGEAISVARQAANKAAKRIATQSDEIIKGVSDIASDVAPRASQIRSRQVAKALDLTPKTDIARIERITGNDIGDFMGRNQLLKDTVEETEKALSTFKRRNYDLVRNATFLVDETYAPSEIAGFESVLNRLRSNLQDADAIRFKAMKEQLDRIANKSEIELSDVQYVKSASDDLESLFRRGGRQAGTPKEGIANEDAAELTSQLRRFIEDRVQEAYPDINIRELNNNVQTSKEIADAIIANSGRADTRSAVSLGDYFILGSGASVNPAVGMTALAGKKVLESSPMSLRIARMLDNKIRSGQFMGTDLDELERIISEELDRALQSPDLPL